MHYGLRFDTVETRQDISELGDFMRQQIGEYDPGDYISWLENVCLPDIERGQRRAPAWWRDGHMVGDAVVKPLGQNLAELKHFRIADPTVPSLERRGLGRFLMAQTLHEAVELLAEQGLITADANTVIVRLDTVEGGPAQAFFVHNGFRQVGSAALYVPDRMEALMEREVVLG